MRPGYDGSIALEGISEAIVVDVTSRLLPEEYGVGVLATEMFDHASNSAAFDRHSASRVVRALVELAWLNAENLSDHPRLPEMVATFNAANTKERRNLLKSSDVAVAMLATYTGHLAMHRTATEGPLAAIHTKRLVKSGRKPIPRHPPRLLQ